MIALAGALQAKPNFTGEWKVNIDKSDYGPMPPPQSVSLKIDHKDPEMKVATTQNGDQGEMKFDATYSTDGKETTNLMGPMQVKSTAVWEGDELVMTSKIDVNGMDIGIKGKWTLSEDGKTLTQSSHLTSPQGEFDMKQVLEKQEKK
jgi:hypothetical protein